MSEDNITDMEYARRAFEETRQMGNFDDKKVGKEFERLFNQLHDNHDTLLEIYAIVKALEQSTRKVMLEEAERNNELEQTQRVLAGFDPDEHLNLNLVFQRGKEE